MDKKMLDRTASQAAQRAQQYWYTDGIAEMVMGGFFMLLGLYFGAQALLPADSFLGSMLTPALLLVVVGGGLVGRRLIGKLKERLTYPRTGYVAYRQPAGKRRWLTAAVGFGMALLVSSLFASSPASQRWIPAIGGLLIGVFWLYYAHRLQVVRLHIMAVISAITGVAITLSGMPETVGLPMYYSVMGVILVLSGGITLWAYLRRTRDLRGEGGEELS